MATEEEVQQLLRSLDIEPDARLVNEPPTLGLAPSAVLTPEQQAERISIESERLGRLAQHERDRRTTARRRGRPW